MRPALSVFPRSYTERRGIGSGVGKGFLPVGQLPPVVDQVCAERLPLFPDLADAVCAALPSQCPDVDVLVPAARIGFVDTLQNLGPGGEEIEEQRILGSRV